MSHEFHEHWLSAYLDDELSSEERALVERRLEEDPQTRQLLEDLKRVRGLVATLPNWEGKEFQFDMNRLERDLDDEEDSEPSLAPTDSQPSLASSNSVKASSAKSKSSGISPAPWRGLLAVAAGILLLILCAPVVWQQLQLPLAFDTSGPGAPAGSGLGNGALPDEMMGGMGGGSVGSMELATEHSPDQAFGTEPPAMPAPAMPAPAMPAPAMPAATPGTLEGTPEGAPAYAEQQNFARGSGTGAPELRHMTPAAPNVAQRGLPGGLNQPTDPADVSANAARSDSAMNLNRGRNAPQAKMVQPDLGTPLSDRQASNIPGNLAPNNQLMLARSAAWSDTEVAAAMPQLRTIVPESRALSEGATTSEQKNNDAAHEWLITSLPPAVDVKDRFVQLQTAHALTPVQIGANEPVVGKLNELNLLKNEANTRGHIVLFVTENEAKQILSTALGRPADGYWRVKPPSRGDQDAQSPQPAKSGDEKVIVFLKQ